MPVSTPITPRKSKSVAVQSFLQGLYECVTAVSLDTALAIVTSVVKCPSQEAGASLVVA